MTDDLAVWERRCEAFLRTQPPADAAHDLGHVRRVVAAARRLAAAEGADPWVVVPAAWLHDAVAVPKSDPRRAEASRLSGTAAAGFLRAEGFPEEKIPAVVHAVEAHSFSAGIEPRTVEAAVVQDADRLDALGAVGVARCFAISAVLGLALFDPDEPLPTTRPPDDRRYAVDHFFAKLFTLPATMRTAAGRAEAERRAAFMRSFLDQLAAEVGG